MKIIFLHGYTGTRKNFADFPNTLEKQGYEVELPLLPGHEDSPFKLSKLNYQDFYDWTEKNIIEKTSKDEGLVIIGYSLGATLALEYASKHPTTGLVLISPVTKLKPPYHSNILTIANKVLRYVPHLRYNPDRKKDKSYKLIPTKGLDLIKEGNMRIATRAHQIKCNILAIQFDQDEIIAPDSSEHLKTLLPNARFKISKVHTENNYHNVFDLPSTYGIKEKIVSFLNAI
jgi:carboxylesterase